MGFVLKHEASFGKSDEELQILDAFHELKRGKTDEDLDDIMCDIEDTYECKESEECGIGAMVAEIMARETGLKFVYFGEDDDYSTVPAIMWRATYPWMLNEKEHTLMESGSYGICRRYMEELGLDEDPEELEQVYSS